MPTYEYRCRSCGFELEEFQSMTEAPLTRCPSCSSDSLARILGGGGGLIFRGSGFYLTDYKKEGAGTAKKKEEKKPDAPPAPSTPSGPPTTS